MTQTNGHKLMGVINNVGEIDLGADKFQPISKWEWIIDANVIGTVRVIKASLPEIRNNKGRVIILGSASGVVSGMQRYGAYQTSKHAVEAVSDSLRSELLEHDVNVSLIPPGCIRSDMTVQQTQSSLRDVPVDERKTYTWSYSDSL
jgi:NAD(P)-dependent dehydrogenase (short-subunit alcohol dehydrogenase family)